ncbi:murein hydrolase activator EnvC family protein [Patescibacteria group bacterium]
MKKQNPKINNVNHYLALVVMSLIGVFVITTAIPAIAGDDVVDDLNNKINDKRIKIKELEEQKQEIQSKVQSKQSEINTISGQLSVIDNSIGLTTLNINSAETELEKLELEMAQLADKIQKKEETIGQKQNDLSELVRLIYRQRNKSNLEVILGDETFSEFFSQMKYATELEGQAKVDLDRLNALKHELEIQQEDLNGKSVELKETSTKLKQQQFALVEQQSYQEALLNQVEKEKINVEATAEELTAEINSANATISSLLRQFRKSGGEFNFEFDGRLIWPVNPSGGISAYFHDPKYPYRNLFEHNAIDIPKQQGTQVLAAADGEVKIARNVGWNTTYCPAYFGNNPCPAYNYIIIYHGNDIATTYGHLSQIYVAEDDLVKQGEVIALSGGTPGTAGAGLLTTGAHLHFEVRELNEDGYPIAVDPLLYLP